MGSPRHFLWENKAENRYQAVLLRQVDGIAALVESTEMMLADMGCNAADAQQMAIVAEEILTNISRHAWPEGEDKEFSACLDIERLPAGINVRFSTCDDGIAYDPLARSAPDIDASLEDREIGGLGIHMVKNFTDSQRYERRGAENHFAVSKLCKVTGAEL